jgi:tryptophanyl-tRNA synthetase
VLRNQFDDTECLRNLYLLGHHVDDADFDGSEEDNHAYHVALGIVDPTMTFRRRLSLALMASDFITLGQRARVVLVLLGIDEHPYVRFAASAAARLPGTGPLHGRFRISAIYSRLISGFGGHPKMSKSIPGSSITVESPPDEIRSLIPGDRCRVPETSPTYQILCHTMLRPPEECTALAAECATASSTWHRAQVELADYLVSIAELW